MINTLAVVVARKLSRQTMNPIALDSLVAHTSGMGLTIHPELGLVHWVTRKADLIKYSESQLDELVCQQFARTC